MNINWRIFAFSLFFSILITAVLVVGFTYSHNSGINNFIIVMAAGLFLFLILIFYLIANYDNYKGTKKYKIILFTILLVILPPIYFLYEVLFGDLKMFEKKIFPFFYTFLIGLYLFFVICFYFKEKLQLK